MPGKSIVLIHPPFCMPDKPYISTAVLYGYLKEKGIDVSVLDLNIEFYRRYLSLENIKQGLEFIKKRLSCSGDDAPGMDERQSLITTTMRMGGETPPFECLFTSAKRSNSEQFKLFSLALNIVSAPHYPERLEFPVNTGYIRYKSTFQKFSSQSLVESLKAPNLYSEAVTAILNEKFKDNPPRLAGISVSFPDQILPAVYTASVIKAISPETHVCMGGTFVSSHMRTMDNTGFFDHVDSLILDEGEETLSELYRCLTESRSFDSIAGLVCMSDGHIVSNPPRPPALSAPLTQPDYTCTDLDRYLVAPESMAFLYRLSQGCYWHRCSFCRTERSFVSRYIQAGLTDVTGWIKDCIKNHPVRILHFTDDAADPGMLYDLSSYLIKNSIKISWITNMRFDSRITTGMLAACKQAGCRAIYFGLESCTPRILKKMKKGITLSGVETILTACRNEQIPVHLYMIVGFPGETEEEALESFSRVYNWKERGLAHQVVYNVFQISGGSDIASSPMDYGISRLPCPEDLDMEPPISDFNSSGMSRKKAKKLCADFITRLDCIQTYSKKDMMNMLFNTQNPAEQRELV